MTQNTADPAPASQNNGNARTPTAVYWCAKLISLPAKYMHITLALTFIHKITHKTSYMYCEPLYIFITIND